MDANPTWAGIRMQLFESARWFHTHRILFLNDPDHVCVRTKADWAKSVLSLISLSGELCMLSDTQQAYTPEKLDIIRKTLPPPGDGHRRDRSPVSGVPRLYLDQAPRFCRAVPRNSGGHGGRQR